MIIISRTNSRHLIGAGAALLTAAAVLRDEDALGLIGSILAWPFVSIRSQVKRRLVIRRRRREAALLHGIRNEAHWLLTKLPPSVTMDILDRLPPSSLGKLRQCSRQCQLVVDNSLRREKLLISSDLLAKFATLPLSSMHASLELIQFALHETNRTPSPSWASLNFISWRNGGESKHHLHSTDKAVHQSILKSLVLAADSLLLDGLTALRILDFTRCEAQSLDPSTLSRLITAAPGVKELMISTESLVLDSKQKSYHTSNASLPLSLLLSALATIARSLRSGGTMQVSGPGFILKRDEDLQLISLDTALTSRLSSLHLLDAHLYSSLRWSKLFPKPFSSLKSLAVSISNQEAFDNLLRSLSASHKMISCIETLIIDKTDALSGAAIVAKHQDLIHHLSSLPLLSRLGIQSLSLEGDAQDQALTTTLPSLIDLSFQQLVVSDPLQKDRLSESFPNLKALGLGNNSSNPFQLIPNPLLLAPGQGVAAQDLVQQNLQKRLSILDLRPLSQIEALSLSGSAAVQISTTIKASVEAGEIISATGLFSQLASLRLVGVASEADLSLILSLLPTGGLATTVDLSFCSFSEQNVRLLAAVTDISVRGDSSSLLVKLLSEGRQADQVDAKIERLCIQSNATLLPEDVESLLLSIPTFNSYLSSLRSIRISGCPHLHPIAAPLLQRIADDVSGGSVYVTIYPQV